MKIRIINLKSHGNYCFYIKVNITKIAYRRMCPATECESIAYQIFVRCDSWYVLLKSTWKKLPTFSNYKNAHTCSCMYHGHVLQQQNEQTNVSYTILIIIMAQRKTKKKK